MVSWCRRLIIGAGGEEAPGRSSHTRLCRLSHQPHPPQSSIPGIRSSVSHLLLISSPPFPSSILLILLFLPAHVVLSGGAPGGAEERMYPRGLCGGLLSEDQHAPRWPDRQLRAALGSTNRRPLVYLKQELSHPHNTWPFRLQICSELFSQAK